MKLTKQIIALMLALVLSAGCWSLADGSNETTLTLPGAVKVIEEEAFMGSGAFTRVIVPEGATDIQSKAFADSSVEFISLPDSIQFIAEDAFDGSKLTSVSATAGKYAHDWMLDHGYLEPLDAELTHALVYAQTTIKTGNTAEWRADVTGGVEPYRYTFRLYRDDAPIKTVAGSALNTFTYQFLEAGEYYVILEAFDANGDSATAVSKRLTVIEGEPEIVEFDSIDDSFKTIKAHIWIARAIGGKEPYQYRYVLKKDGSKVYARDYSSKASLYYTFFDSGSYTLTVTAKDASGVKSKTVQRSFTVADNPTNITGVVRIYVDVNSNGEVIRKDSKTGHYELQINNAENNHLAYDDHLYVNPTFSFQSGSGGIGIVGMSDGNQILRANSILYEFPFDTTAALLKDFMIDKMQALYLDMDSEITDDTWSKYEVASGPFVQYAKAKTNCFTAVATWCQWLDYDELSKVVKKASSYLDYLAWRMLDAYGSQWTYVDAAEDPSEASSSRAEMIETVLAKAEAQVGKLYANGGGYYTFTPTGFDSGGLVFWCWYYGSNKTVKPANSAFGQCYDSRYTDRRVTDWRALERGDVLCFRDAGSNIAKTTALYLGDGRFICASSEAGRVVYGDFNADNADWANRLAWGYRVI